MTTRQEREKANRQYLKDKVDQHLNKLIIELLRDKPEDVVIHFKIKKTAIIYFVLGTKAKRRRHSCCKHQQSSNTTFKPFKLKKQVDDAPVVDEKTPEEPMQAPEGTQFNIIQYTHIHASPKKIYL